MTWIAVVVHPGRYRRPSMRCRAAAGESGTAYSSMIRMLAVHSRQNNTSLG